MKIIKRSGTEVVFDITKIISAITKANNSVDEKERLTTAQIHEAAANVEKTYGTARFPNMDLCAKSGTAEVGEGQPPHAWFAGFLADPETPYAFVVLVENGGGGNTVAGTVAGRVLNVMVNGY